MESDQNHGNGDEASVTDNDHVLEHLPEVYAALQEMSDKGIGPRLLIVSEYSDGTMKLSASGNIPESPKSS